VRVCGKNCESLLAVKNDIARLKRVTHRVYPWTCVSEINCNDDDDDDDDDVM